jgi:hypothetical protein
MAPCRLHEAKLGARIIIPKSLSRILTGGKNQSRRRAIAEAPAVSPNDSVSQMILIMLALSSIASSLGIFGANIQKADIIVAVGGRKTPGPAAGFAGIDDPYVSLGFYLMESRE